MKFFSRKVVDPAPVRPDYPCGVGDCFEPQVVLEQDAKDTKVECPIHGCVTTWETTKREAREQIIIRPSSAWAQYGSKDRPKK